MAIGIEKLHGDLTTRPAPPFERDRGTLFVQPLAHAPPYFGSKLPPSLSPMPEFSSAPESPTLKQWLQKRD
jgi:hypothetical protein